MELNMKRFFAIIITAVLALGAVSVPALAVTMPQTLENTTPAAEESTTPAAEENTTPAETPVSAPAPAAVKPVDDGVVLDKEINETAAERGSVVELIKFNAERSTSEAVRREIMMINADIGDTIEPSVRVADRELLDGTYEGNFEIRAYPFVSEKYLQYIATSIEYPTYGRDPYAYSWVYDRVNKKYVRLSDALIEDGLTEDEILKAAEKLYLPFKNDYLFGGKVCGFYMTDDNTRSYILRMNMINPDAEGWIELMTYTPGDNGGTLYQSVLHDENFTPVKAEAKETDNGNRIWMNVKYRSEDAENYIRFMRDQYAIVKLDGKISAWFYYRGGDTIVFQKDMENFEGKLTANGIKLTVNLNGKDILFVPETISADYFS
jgi:hypothetical protein